MEPMPVTITELYALIGEREVIKFKLGEQIRALYTQIDEMAETITKIRQQHAEAIKENMDLQDKLNELTRDELKSEGA